MGVGARKPAKIAALARTGAGDEERHVRRLRHLLRLRAAAHAEKQYRGRQQRITHGLVHRFCATLAYFTGAGRGGAGIGGKKRGLVGWAKSPWRDMDGWRRLRRRFCPRCQRRPDATAWAKLRPAISNNESRARQFCPPYAFSRGEGTPTPSRRPSWRQRSARQRRRRAPPAAASRTAPPPSGSPSGRCHHRRTR